MNLFKRWLRKQSPALTAAQSERLAAWKMLPNAIPHAPFENSRYVVVDVETTGLNLRKDSLISIGAVAVVNGRIELADSFSVVLQQHESSTKENILIHGISGSVQREGSAPVDALLNFIEYLGKSPLVAFHVFFDETMINRAMSQYLGLSFKHPWLDLAYVLPALYPRLAHSHHSLDAWSSEFNIHNEERHNALADALVTAQLMLISMAQIRRTEAPTFDALRYIERTLRNATGRV